jgi:hypothetical protein
VEDRDLIEKRGGPERFGEKGDRSIDEQRIEEAGQRVESLAREISERGFEPAFDALERGLDRLTEAGFPPEMLLPTGQERRGVALSRSKDGRSFWAVYADVVRDELCRSGGQLQRLIKAGLSRSATAILTTVMIGLGLPAIAVGIAVPIAAILAAEGVDAFCRVTDDDVRKGRSASAAR